MQKRHLTLTLAFTFLIFAAPAQGDPIPITAGTLTGVGMPSEPVEIALSGLDFHAWAMGAPVAGVWSAGNCHYGECRSGAVLDLQARWSGTDLPGTVTYLGSSYTGVGSLDVNTALYAAWDAVLTIPETFAGGVLTTPFLFEGMFVHPAGAVALWGTGLVSAHFVSRGDGSYALPSISYDFFDTEDMAPNPEPTTLLLLGTGILAIARRVRS